LAQLLAEARRQNDESLTALAARSDGAFSRGDLLALEAGAAELDDDTVRRVVELYRIDPGVLAPERSRLVVDLDERRLRAGTHEQALGAPTADEVLATYLSLVYTMRHASPGTPLPLRDNDISVLSRVLELTSVDIESRLVELMADPDDEVADRHRWLRARVLVPAAGVLVAVTAVGSLIFVSGREDAPAVAPVAPTDVTVTEVPASLIPPVVVERDANGQPTPQVTVQVEIGDAIVVERQPNGEPGPQVPRR
jgi:hypothetical protein